VDGSWGRELITIERSGGDDVIVRANNLTRQFDMDNFDGVMLRGNAGWDDLRVLDPIVAGSLVRKVTLDGGTGNDTFTGSDGDDVLRGGDGNDQIDAGHGNDALFGGGGDDGLVGSVGLDFMDGGDGNDFLGAREGSGGDTVLGGNGTDRASVDAGDETSGIETFV
jgi:Ca2+-binding RTX toxin-like protein